MQETKDISGRIPALDMAIHHMVAQKAKFPLKDFPAGMEVINKELNAISLLLIWSTIPPHHFLHERSREICKRVVNLGAVDIVPPPGPPTGPDSEADTKPYKADCKIAPLPVPHFSGKTADWLPFRNNFQRDIANRKDLSDGARMAYLTQSMDDPDLKRSLSDRSGEDVIYHIMVKELQRRYDRPRVMHRKYVETMKSLTTIRAKFADTLENTLNGFIRLKGENCRQIMTTMAESVLPDIAQHYWSERTIKCREVPPVEELIEFYRERGDHAVEEEASRPRQLPAEKKGGRSNSFKQKAGVNVSAPQQLPQQNTTTPVHHNNREVVHHRGRLQ